jgi:hypothetical protein
MREAEPAAPRLRVTSNTWSHILASQNLTLTPRLHFLPLTVSAIDPPVRSDSIMSGSPTQPPPPPGPPPGPPPSSLQSQASVLGPGIAGLLIQGIESGLVFAQFSQWFFGSDRIENSLISIVVVFVTLVGLYVFSDFSFCVLIIRFKVHSPEYALRRLGLNMYCTLGCPYVSLCSCWLRR